MYFDYAREREGKLTYQTEFGFVMYVIHPEKEIYLSDMYIVPKHRNAKNARHLVNHVFQIAKIDQIPKVRTTVYAKQKDATEYVKLNIHFGFRFEGAIDNMIVFCKDVF